MLLCDCLSLKIYVINTGGPDIERKLHMYSYICMYINPSTNIVVLKYNFSLKRTRVPWSKS